MMWSRPLPGVCAVLVTVCLTAFLAGGLCFFCAGVVYGSQEVEVKGEELGGEKLGGEKLGGESLEREKLGGKGLERENLGGQALKGKELRREKRHWNLGDVVERELDGNVYQFRCIDQNYSDRMENHGPAALFLCASVIPADIGSGYRYEELADGRFDYVFYPGPIVNFGDGNDYKYSAVRRWLENCERSVPEACHIYTGVDLAYEGRTGNGSYGQLDTGALRGSYIGSQKLTERLFCLSVDEALKYREELWKFEGSRVENPESQYGPYSKGYWLRNPVGDKDGYEDSGMVYIVDLINGNIRPQAVKPGGNNGGGELDVTGTTGVRPAFAMPQDS